jgi:hypothetical protein
MTEIESNDLENMDEGIRGVVRILQIAGVVTVGSCQGGGYGWGHGYLRPTVLFEGDDQEGPRARKIVSEAGFIVSDLHRRYFENGGTQWVLEFVCGAAHG